MKSDRHEMLWILAWAVVVVSIASLPYLYGLWLTPEGFSFVGFTYNNDDAAVYLSWTRQASDGNLYIRNLFTNEPQLGRQVNLLFLAMGSVARITHLSGTAVYHLFRVGLGLALFIAIWRFAGLFLSGRRERMAVIPIAGLSSGIGWMIPGAQFPVGSVDVWQPEAITFLSIYLNPLFLAGLLLMLGSLYYLVMAERTGKARWAVVAGIHVFLLANVHTYDVLTVAVVWTAYVLVQGLLQKRIPTRTIIVSLLAAAVSVPALAYQIYNYVADPVFRDRANDVIAAPPIWSFFTGYGLVLIAAAVGAVVGILQCRKKLAEGGIRERLYLLPLVWSIVGFAVPYLPVAQQRKLVMGLHIPLCILASIAVVYLLGRLKPRLALPLAAVLILTAFQSNWQFMQRDMQLLEEGRTVTRYPAFLSAEQLRAMEYIRNHVGPHQVTLADPQISLFLPGYAGRPVCYGHWSETPDYEHKVWLWAKFVSPELPLPMKKALLSRFDCDYLLLNTFGDEQMENSLGALPLTRVTRIGDIVVYRVAGTGGHGVGDEY